VLFFEERLMRRFPPRSAAVYVDTARRTAAERGGKRLIKRSSKKSTSTRKGK